MFDSLNDHDFNRLISALDFLAFFLVTPEFLGDRLLNYTQNRATDTDNAFSKIIGDTIASQRMTVAINVLALINLPVLMYYLITGFSYYGPVWIQVLAYGIGIVSVTAILAFVICFLAGILLGVTRILAVRTHLLRLGAAIFVTARVAVLIHG